MSIERGCDRPGLRVCALRRRSPFNYHAKGTNDNKFAPQHFMPNKSSGADWKRWERKAVAESTLFLSLATRFCVLTFCPLVGRLSHPQGTYIHALAHPRSNACAMLVSSQGGKCSIMDSFWIQRVDVNKSECVYTSQSFFSSRITLEAWTLRTNY
jgi:hypothetical protein